MSQSMPAAGQRCIQFCEQKVLCKDDPFSFDQLRCLLEMACVDHAAVTGKPFTGYLKFAGEGCYQLFLFFFKGKPYAAGRYDEGKPTVYTIQELARQLVKTDKATLRVTLCETDPVLLKSMLLFLQKEPAIKAPTSLIDFEHIVRQIGEVGEHAMIALCRDGMYTCYFFKDGVCAQIYYADTTFERPDGMSLDEEMFLYAFQPGVEIQAYIYRDMNTTVAEDSSQYDKESLYTLLTVGYLKNKRKSDQEVAAESNAENRGAVSPRPAAAPPAIILSIESGVLQGSRVSTILPCTIGRKECDLLFDDRLVSRRHAVLKSSGDGVVIEDLASKNGTKVNGEKIVSSPVKPGDLISIGPINLRVVAE